GKLVGAIREALKADLGSLQVNENRYVAARFLGGLTNVLVHLGVLFRASVAAVDAGDVHASGNKLAHVLKRSRCGSNSADNLCVTHISNLVVVKHGAPRFAP